jgi:hypothetical protein
MADKGDPNNPGSFKGTFSFVNKDAGNLSSKEHSAAVLWHVQHRYERWKKQQLARRLRTSANIPGTASSSSTPAEPSSDAVSIMGSQSAGHGTDTSTGQTQLNLPPFEIPAWTAMPSYMQHGEQSRSETSGSSASGANTPALAEAGSIPFGPRSTTATESSNTTPIPGTPLVNSLINFAYQALIPSAWPNEGGANPPSHELTRSWDDLAIINDDECYANALFAVIAGAMATATGNDALLQHSQSFQAKAMMALRNRIQSQQDLRNPMTFRAILNLFTSETIVGNAAAARVHLKMLRHLVVEAGGIITLDSWFKENLVCCDAYFALRYETRPHFPATEWTPGPLNVAWKGHIAAARGYGEEAVEIDVSVEHRTLREVIADLRELSQVWDYVATHVVPPDEPLLRWRQLRKFDCISRLADHLVNLTIFPHLYQDPTVQICICTAVMLWAGMVFGSPEPVRLGSKLLVDLRQRLGRWKEDEDLMSLHPNLRFWIADLGVKAGKTLPGLQNEKEWFQQTMEQIKEERGGENATAFRALLKNFLYSDRLQQDIDSGVKYREVDVRQGIYSVSGCSWRAPLEETSTPEAEAAVKGKEKA